MKTRISSIIVILGLSVVTLLAQNNYQDDLYGPSRKTTKTIKTPKTTTTVQGNIYSPTQNHNIEMDADDQNSVVIETYDQALLRRMKAYSSDEHHPEEFWNIQEKYIEYLAKTYDENFFNIISINDQAWVEPRYITSMFDNSDPIGDLSVYKPEAKKTVINLTVNVIDPWSSPWYSSWYSPYRYNWYSPYNSWGWGGGYYPSWGWGGGYYPSWGWGGGHYPHWGGGYPIYGGGHYDSRPRYYGGNYNSNSGRGGNYRTGSGFNRPGSSTSAGGNYRPSTRPAGYENQSSTRPNRNEGVSSTARPNRNEGVNGTTRPSRTQGVNGVTRPSRGEGSVERPALIGQPNIRRYNSDGTATQRPSNSVGTNRPTYNRPTQTQRVERPTTPTYERSTPSRSTYTPPTRSSGGGGGGGGNTGGGGGGGGRGTRR